jgi:tetratricopeptide (TPR) repeat protein
MMFHGLYNLNEWVQAESQLTMLEASQSRMTMFERQYVRSCRSLLEGRLAELLDFQRDLVRRAPHLMTFTFLQGLYAIWVNHPQEAIKSLETIPVDWIPLGGPRAWASLFLAHAYHLVGDFAGQLRIAKERSVLFPDVLDLNGEHAMALAALGRLDGIDRVIDSCLAIQARARSGTPASVMVDVAHELRVHGYREKAVAVGERAISWLGSTSPEEQKKSRFQLGQVYYLMGKWQEAARIFSELARESAQDINYQGYLGALAVRQGDRAGAERIAESLRALDGRYRFGQHTYCRARIASLLGEKDEAVALLRDAFAQGYRFSISVHRDPDFEPLRDYPPYQELLRPKG